MKSPEDCLDGTDLLPKVQDFPFHGTRVPTEGLELPKFVEVLLESLRQGPARLLKRRPSPKLSDDSSSGSWLGLPNYWIYYFARSTTIAIPWPPPMHSVARPCAACRRCIS